MPERTLVLASRGGLRTPRPAFFTRTAGPAVEYNRRDDSVCQLSAHGSLIRNQLQ